MSNHSKFRVEGKTVIIAGGSRGLGKELAIELATHGANTVILGRIQHTLDLAKQDVSDARRSSKQTVVTFAVDLSVAEEVDVMLSKLGTIPDVVICTAGGTPTQGGFLAEITPEAIKSCMELNYYTSAFIVQSCLRLWLAAPKSTETRHIVLTSSTAAFVGLPGYVAYTTTKVAIRALADTLRQELLMYGEDAFKVHCTFPGNFLSDSLIREQAGKPKLLKMMDGTDYPDDELRKRIMSSATVAKKIIEGLEAGKVYITVDFEGQLLLNNMRGPSPRYNAFLDFCIGLIAGVAWWWVRLDFDRKTRKYGREHYAQLGGQEAVNGK